MNLDLRGFDSFPAEAVLEVEAELADFAPGQAAVREAAVVRLVVQDLGDQYFCQGNLTVTVEEECSRCLTLFGETVTGELSFFIRFAAKTGLESEDDEVIFLKPGEHVVDLREMVREAIILALPFKPLCDPECKGLCQYCGANLNEGACACRQDKPDDRWEDLKDLME